MPPPSPRDMRNSQRSAQKRTIAHNRSLEFTSLEDCDNRMLKTCIRGKRICSKGLEDSAATTGTARGNNGEARQEEDVVQKREHDSPEKRGEARREDERLAFTETLQRGGLLLQGACVLPTATTPQQHDLFASGANLIKRPRSASRASSSGHVSHTSSPDEKATGVANSDNGRHSRLSGRGLHSAVKLLTRAASSSSLMSIRGRSSSLRSSRNGSFNSISYPFSSNGSSSGSLMASSTGVLSAAATRMRDMETPPGAPDALEAHKVLVHCPPPLRSTMHANRRADQVASRGLSLM